MESGDLNYQRRQQYHRCRYHPYGHHYQLHLHNPVLIPTTIVDGNNTEASHLPCQDNKEDLGSKLEAHFKAVEDKLQAIRDLLAAPLQNRRSETQWPATSTPPSLLVESSARLRAKFQLWRSKQPLRVGGCRWSRHLRKWRFSVPMTLFTVISNLRSQTSPSNDDDLFNNGKPVVLAPYENNRGVKNTNDQSLAVVFHRSRPPDHLFKRNFMPQTREEKIQSRKVLSQTPSCFPVQTPLSNRPKSILKIPPIQQETPSSLHQHHQETTSSFEEPHHQSLWKPVGFLQHEPSQAPLWKPPDLVANNITLDFKSVLESNPPNLITAVDFGLGEASKSVSRQPWKPPWIEYTTRLCLSHNAQNLFDKCDAVIVVGTRLNWLLYFDVCDLVSTRKLFDKMPIGNSVTSACLISWYTQNDMLKEACVLFKGMICSGFVPNHYAFGSVLRACQIHGLILKIWYHRSNNWRKIKLEKNHQEPNRVYHRSQAHGSQQQGQYCLCHARFRTKQWLFLCPHSHWYSFEATSFRHFCSHRATFTIPGYALRNGFLPNSKKIVNLVDWLWELYSEGRIIEAACKWLNGDLFDRTVNHEFTAMYYPLLINSIGILACLITTLFAIDFFEIKVVNEIKPALSHSICEQTGAIDAVRNPTTAIGKGFAIGSATLASLTLLGAFISTIDVLTPKVFTGMIVGAMLPYWFSAITMKSVGNAALTMFVGSSTPFQESWRKPDYAALESGFQSPVMRASHLLRGKEC